MTKSGSTIFKNASALFVAQIVTWALTLLLTLIQPRFLGAAGVGELSIALALWGLGSVLITFGMDTLLTKHIARSQAAPTDLLGTSLWLRVLFYGVGAVVITGYMLGAGFSNQAMIVVHLIGLSVLLWQLSGALQAVLQALEIMQYISVANVAAKALNTFLGIGVLMLGFGLFGLSIVLILAALSCFLIEFYYLNRHHRIDVSFKAARALPILRDSLPYVMASLVSAAYSHINTLILGWMMSSEQVGWYGSAAQLFGTLLFVPVVFTTAIFPMLTRTHANNPQALPLMMRKSFELMLLIGIPIGLGVLAIANQLVTLLFGAEFAPAGPVLQVLGITLIFMYFNVLLGQFFTSIDRQNLWTICIGVSTVCMVVVTMLLIPWCQQEFGNGALGAASGLLLAEVGMVVVGAALLPRSVLGWSTAWIFIRVMLAGGAMVAVTWLLRDAFILFSVIAGAATYVLLVGVLRIVPQDDLALLRQLVQSTMGKVLRKRNTLATSTQMERSFTTNAHQQEQ